MNPNEPGLGSAAEALAVVPQAAPSLPSLFRAGTWTEAVGPAAVLPPMA